MRKKLFEYLLRWYRGRLEDQIDKGEFDRELSLKLDAVDVLLTGDQN